MTYLASSSLTSSLTSLKFVAFLTDEDADPLLSTALLNTSLINSFTRTSEFTKSLIAVDFASDVTISVFTPFGVFVTVTFTNVVLTGGCSDDVADIVVVLVVVLTATSVNVTAVVVDGVTSGGDDKSFDVGICSVQIRIFLPNIL